MERTLVAMCAALLLGCGGGGSKPAPAPKAGTPATDLEMICETAKTSATRDAFASAVDRQLATEEVRRIFRAAGTAADGEKNALIQQGAKEVGVPAWDCAEPLTKLYGPQTALTP